MRIKLGDDIVANVKVTFPGGKKVATEVGGFTLIADQSEASGGDNAGPSPFDFFLSSIASCTGMTILAFCKNKGIDTSDLKMELNVEKNEDGDVVKIITQVTRPKDFPERYMGAIEHIAGTCKVKRHIENPPKFEIIVK